MGFDPPAPPVNVSRKPPAMPHEEIKRALLASYETDGGINHLDGINLPAEDSVNQLARDFMHLLFPGYFEDSSLNKNEVPTLVERLLKQIETRLIAELEKCMRFNRDASPADRARELTLYILGQIPAV